MFQPLPCDVFVYVDEGTGFTSKVSRWAIGRYNHVSMYFGKILTNTPFIYESNGRGVSIVSLQHQTGRLVTVLRLTPQADAAFETSLIVKLLSTMINIASDPQSYYDYLSYVTNCLPRVLKEKIPWLPIPSQYHRDAAMICSEAVAEVFWRNEIDVLPQVPRTMIVLPGDFVKSSLFDIKYEGRILEDITFQHDGYGHS